MHKGIRLLIVISMLFTFSIRQVKAKAKTSSIVLNYQDDATKKAIKGARFTLNQVASGTANNYKIHKDYKKLNVKLSSTASLTNLETAKKLAQVSKKGKSKTTNKKGMVTFSKLNAGVYLIRQSKSVKKYQKVEPFLVFVTNETTKISYDLSAIEPVTLPSFGS